MKTLLSLLLFVFLLQSCKQENLNVNTFSSLSDTLVIKTSKQPGSGLFQWGTGMLHFSDSINLPYKPLLPKDLADIKYAQKLVDFQSENKKSVDIILGLKNGEKVFVVDENFNKNFTDDSLRIYKKIDWYSKEDFIKCVFEISDENRIIKDFSWLKVGEIQGNFLCGRNEHLIANFNIDDIEYKIGLISTRSGDFTYGMFTEAAMLSNGKKVKDTLLSKEIIALDEFFKLNNSYYRFAEISKLGDKVTLIKEHDFESKVGTQLGMLAPEFEAVSISGETVNSKVLHDKVIVVANACGCGGDKISTQAISNLKAAFGNEVHVIGLDSKIDKNQEGLFVDVEEVFNKDIYEKYRKQYCSRTCYVIDKDNRIVDKFEVGDWKLNLPKTLGKLADI